MDVNFEQFYEFGPFRLDPKSRRLIRDGEIVTLPPKALEALLVLVRNPGKPMEREVLMKAVWANSFVEDANLTVAISHLRKALGQNGESAEYVETIPRVGYRFVADVREVQEEPAPLVIEKRTMSRTVIEEDLVYDKPHPIVKTGAIRVQPIATRRRFTRTVGLLLFLAVLVAVAVASTLYFRRDRAVMSPDRVAIASIRSIAVLPPKPLIDESNNAPLSLGLADALITRLGGLRKVVVRPTSATIRYIGDQDSLNAGRALGVDALLDGTLQRDNGRMRLTLRLVNVADGMQLWAGNFDEADADIFKLQDQVSQQVAQILFADVSQTDRAALTKHQTTNPEAYALYLKGNYFWKKRGMEAGKSREYFRKAIAQDPNFAEAYVQLAAANSTSELPSPEADALIEKALQLDNASAEAHATYGFISMFHHYDWTTAQRELDRAIELNPNSVTAHHWKGVYLSLRGRLDEAKVEMHRALELDPLSLIVIADIGQLHYFAHEYDGAIDYCNSALSLDHSFDIAQIYRRNSFLMKGMEQEFYDDFRHTWGERLVTNSQSNFDRGGRRGLLLGELKRADSIRSLYLTAWLSASVGEKDKTLEYLNRVFQERTPGAFLLPFVNVDPLYDFLRDDQRFKDLLHRMNLP